jgi:hypothetical protein
MIAVKRVLPLLLWDLGTGFLGHHPPGGEQRGNNQCERHVQARGSFAQLAIRVRPPRQLMPY